jgi:hypothetical protein
MNNYNRIEVIDHRTDGLGRVYTSDIMENVEVELIEQDNKRTLKVFIKDKKVIPIAPIGE